MLLTFGSTHKAIGEDPGTITTNGSFTMPLGSKQNIGEDAAGDILKKAQALTPQACQERPRPLFLPLTVAPTTTNLNGNICPHSSPTRLSTVYASAVQPQPPHDHYPTLI